MKRSPSPAPPLNKKPKAASNVNSQGGSTRKRKHEEITSAATNGSSQESTDLTKSMEAPLSQPLVEEVHIPKNSSIKKENSEYQPYRNGTIIDLDEDNNHHSNEENKVKRNCVVGNFDNLWSIVKKRWTIISTQNFSSFLQLIYEIRLRI